MDERLCKVDALGCAILGRMLQPLDSPMNLDLGPAFTRAQAVVNGLVAAIPGLIVALGVFVDPWSSTPSCSRIRPW